MASAQPREPTAALDTPQMIIEDLDDHADSGQEPPQKKRRLSGNAIATDNRDQNAATVADLLEGVDGGKPKRRKNPWKSAEDALLKQKVEEGLGFVAIAGLLGNRTAKQCRERWNNNLRPTIKQGDFTDEEDLVICEMVAKEGRHCWSKIEKVLKSTRSQNAIKNRFYNRLENSTLFLTLSRRIPQNKENVLNAAPTPGTPRSPLTPISPSSKKGVVVYRFKDDPGEISYQSPSRSEASPMSNRLVSSMITKEEFAGIVAAPIPLAAPTAAEVEEAIVIKNLTFLQKFMTDNAQSTHERRFLSAIQRLITDFRDVHGDSDGRRLVGLSFDERIRRQQRRNIFHVRLAQVIANYKKGRSSSDQIEQGQPLQADVHIDSLLEQVIQLGGVIENPDAQLHGVKWEDAVVPIGPNEMEQETTSVVNEKDQEEVGEVQPSNIKKAVDHPPPSALQSSIQPQAAPQGSGPLQPHQVSSIELLALPVASDSHARLYASEELPFDFDKDFVAPSPITMSNKRTRRLIVKTKQRSSTEDDIFAPQHDVEQSPLASDPMHVDAPPPVVPPYMPPAPPPPKHGMHLTKSRLPASAKQQAVASHRPLPPSPGPLFNVPAQQPLPTLPQSSPATSALKRLPPKTMSRIPRSLTERRGMRAGTPGADGSRSLSNSMASDSNRSSPISAARPLDRSDSLATSSFFGSVSSSSASPSSSSSSSGVSASLNDSLPPISEPPVTKSPVRTNDGFLTPQARSKKRRSSSSNFTLTPQQSIAEQHQPQQFLPAPSSSPILHAPAETFAYSDYEMDPFGDYHGLFSEDLPLPQTPVAIPQHHHHITPTLATQHDSIFPEPVDAHHQMGENNELPSLALDASMHGLDTWEGTDDFNFFS